jgi:hypothetical protein
MILHSGWNQSSGYLSGWSKIREGLLILGKDRRGEVRVYDSSMLSSVPVAMRASVEILAWREKEEGE